MSGPARQWLDRELEAVVRRPVGMPVLPPALSSSAGGPLPSPPPSSSRPLSVSGANALLFAGANVSGSSPNVGITRGNSAVGYNGPALTDADVRRIERGEQ